MTIRYLVALDGPPPARADYALRLLLEGIGVAAARVESPVDADLAYALERPPSLRAGAVWLTASRGDWDASPAASYADPPDIVRAAYELATGAWERSHPRNARGVPVCRGGGALAEGPWSRPFVAKYCDRLAALFAEAAGAPLQAVPRWPDGKTYAIVLSHDVDAPFLRAPWSFYARRLAGNLARRDVRAAVHGVLQMGKTVTTARTLRLPAPADDPNFKFDEWLEIEDAVPARSSFYVAVTTSADAGAAPVDVAYDFRHPELAAALRRAVERGWEVGLHVSVNARLEAGRIEAERARLESVLDGHRVRGSRHHYWALDPDTPERTLWEHARAGLEYDSSLGLNDAPGFRRGMAWPFQPFDRERDEELPILEVPPTLMDGAIFYQRVTEAEGRAAILEHVRDVKRHGGAAVLDWHPEQLNPQRLRGAGAALSSVLPELAADHDAYWTTAAGAAAWWRTRRARIAERS
jgi:hypothetical protein